MKYFLFLLINLLSIRCLGQTTFSRCETVDPHQQGAYQYYHFKDYVKNNLLRLPEDSIYISNRIFLKPVASKRISKDHLEFSWDSSKVTIKKKKFAISSLKNIKIDTFLDPKIIYIDNVNNKFPYGLNIVKDSFDLICNIKYFNGVNEIEIPVSAYDDLFFPNFLVDLAPIRPIELYIDENKNKIFIYIFGLNGQSGTPPWDIDSYDSYMAKIIFDNTGFITRIVANIGDLKAYNWNCPNFTGF